MCVGLKEYLRSQVPIEILTVRTVPPFIAKDAA